MISTSNKIFVCLLLLTSSIVYAAKPVFNSKSIEKKVTELVTKMTVEEKLGQLQQSAGNGLLTGPTPVKVAFEEELKKGRIGSILNTTGVTELKYYQKIAVKQSRLKIPLLIAHDVIHGYKTIFPVPLAESCSWDLKAIEQSAKIAATEASAAGINWTFAPMVDIARDPRWGRVVEGAGEDTYYGCKVAVARVKGFQWNLGGTNSVMACTKHFAAYGMPLAGKDYAPVDMSDRTLYDVYLPPFKATVDAGVATFMSSFNEINGIPTTSNRWLMTDLLKKQWGFNGFVVSDWGSIVQLIQQGVAKDKKDAGRLAFNAGVDMSMGDEFYKQYGEELLKEGNIKQTELDESVKRILRFKFKLGLFDDPFRFLNIEREKNTMLLPEHLNAARDIAKKSIVLLKNEHHILPLSKSVKHIAVIGALANSKLDMLGSWYALGDSSKVVNLMEGLKQKVDTGTTITYTKGCNVEGDDETDFRNAFDAAAKADVVIVACGEKGEMSGESKSRVSIELPGKQLVLVKALIATGKPVVVVLMNGRPLAIPWISENANAIVETWFLGTQAGNAIADVLFGDYNPSGKLTMTFPRTTGQIPIYYNEKCSGRPGDMNQNYTTRFIDEITAPLYPFGYGLSYSNFVYTNLKVDKTIFKRNEKITISITITNESEIDGEEVVQLYVRDLVASVTRPLKELKGFEKIMLNAGESKQVTFSLSANDLSFYNANMQKVTEPGDYEIMVGSSSNEVQKLKVTMLDK